MERSEVAHIVTAAQQPQSLIPAAAQGRRRRPALVISTHHREIQALSDLSPQGNLLRSGFLRDTEVPPGSQFSLGVAGEETEAQPATAVSEFFNQLDEVGGLLHGLAARESDSFNRLRRGRLENRLGDLGWWNVVPLKQVRGFVKAISAVERAALKPDHRPQAWSVCATGGHHRVQEHNQAPPTGPCDAVLDPRRLGGKRPSYVLSSRDRRRGNL